MEITWTQDGWALSYPGGEKIIFKNKHDAEEFLDWRDHQIQREHSIGLVKIVKSAYHQRLQASGIPLMPGQRSIEQQATAALVLWAIKSALSLGVAGVTEDSLVSD